MQAVVVEKYDFIQNIRLKQVPLPEVAAGHVRVKVQFASVGFVDGLKVQGLYQTKDTLPFTPGSEFAGTRRRNGDRCFGRKGEPKDARYLESQGGFRQQGQKENDRYQ